jgi:hypothetical protein
MTPKERYGGLGCMRVARLEPGRDMVLVSPADYENAHTHGVAPEGTWAFLLEPIDERTTRLIVRSRSGSTGRRPRSGLAAAPSAGERPTG